VRIRRFSDADASLMTYEASLIDGYVMDDGYLLDLGDVSVFSHASSEMRVCLRYLGDACASSEPPRCVSVISISEMLVRHLTHTCL